MKRAAAIGMMALTVAVNLAPLKVEAAGLNTCPQNFYGTNAITSIKSCNLEGLTSNLQNLQINGNCINLGSMDQIKDCITKSERACNTNTALPANYGSTNNCKTQSTEIKVTVPEVTVPEATVPEATVPEAIAPEATAQNVTTQETTAPKATTQETTAPKATAPEVKTEDKNATLSYAEQVVRLVNVERAKEGLAALSIDKNVEKAALVRAKEIQSSFSHTRPNGSSFATALKENGVTYRGAGENIAWGQKTPEQVVTAWMNSPGHRANIMNAKYTKIGVGNLQNSAGTQYWVQLFTY